MGIDIRETFRVAAPIEAVWSFMMDPRRVAACMPGAELEEIVDPRTFVGVVKVKVGAITTRYKGRVHLAVVDERAHTIQMVAEGKETSGGTAKGSMSSRMQTLPDGATEVVAAASVDLTGRIVQVGRGMIQGVSHQLFLQFVAAVKAELEPAAAAGAAPAGVAAGGADAVSGATGTSVAAKKQQAIRIVPLILHVIWASLARFFRRLLRRQLA